MRTVGHESRAGCEGNLFFRAGMAWQVRELSALPCMRSVIAPSPKMDFEMGGARSSALYGKRPSCVGW